MAGRVGNRKVIAECIVTAGLTLPAEAVRIRHGLGRNSHPSPQSSRCWPYTSAPNPRRASKRISRLSDGGDVKSPIPPSRVNLIRTPDTAALPLACLSRASRNQNCAYYPTVGLQGARLGIIRVAMAVRGQRNADSRL